MSKKRRKEIVNKGAVFDIEKIHVGDVVAIEWNDAHAYERFEINEIDELEEPETTRCWGAVVRKGRRYLFVATEIGNKDSDGVWIEALPYKMIEKCKVIDKISIVGLP
jgi:hypothetical protein